MSWRSGRAFNVSWGSALHNESLTLSLLRKDIDAGDAGHLFEIPGALPGASKGWRNWFPIFPDVTG